jgi:hypothetical protein
MALKRAIWRVLSAIIRPPTQLLSITQPCNLAMLSVPRSSRYHSPLSIQPFLQSFWSVFSAIYRRAI